MRGSALMALGSRTGPGTFLGEFTIPATVARCPEKGHEGSNRLRGNQSSLEKGNMLESSAPGGESWKPSRPQLKPRSGPESSNRRKTVCLQKSLTIFLNCALVSAIYPV